MSTEEDPKDTLKALLSDNIVLYKDDDLTQATVLVCDEYNEEFWKKYDVILTVGLNVQRERLLGLGGSNREIVASYRVGIWTRDGLGITGQTMRWKAVQEVVRIINEYMKNPGGILSWMRLSGRVDADRTELKPVLYHSDITVETHRYETV